MKFKKTQKGYLSDCGSFLITRERNYWDIYQGNRKCLGRNRTLGAAKRYCEVLEQQRLSDERLAVEYEERKAQLAISREEAKALTAYNPASGISWFEWAEIKVGCTLAELKRATIARDALDAISEGLDILERNDFSESDSEQLYSFCERAFRIAPNDNNWLEKLASEYGFELHATQSAQN